MEHYEVVGGVLKKIADQVFIDSMVLYDAQGDFYNPVRTGPHSYRPINRHLSYML